MKLNFLGCAGFKRKKADRRLRSRRINVGWRGRTRRVPTPVHLYFDPSVAFFFSTLIRRDDARRSARRAKKSLKPRASIFWRTPEGHLSSSI